MPWKLTAEWHARRAFVEACWKLKVTFAAACRQFGISRPTGYRWRKRLKEGGCAAKAAFADRSHCPRAAAQLQQRWRQRVIAMRRKYPLWGADKLRWCLEEQYRLGPWPRVRTISRWLKAAGLTCKRRRRARPGKVIALRRKIALEPNDVWTVDFKGWFETLDRQRVYALTVRDLFSRYVVLVRHMDRTTERDLRAIFTRLFRRYGLPRAIRTDNGPPFGGEGPRGWSTFSVWLARLGIAVEHGRPACPQDNAEHEQMHQVLQKETARPPAPTLAAQQRRFDRWRVRYNERRPHASLGMHPPVAFYRPSPRRFHYERWEYGKSVELIRTDPRGRIHWRRRQRLIGQAFSRQTVALKPLRENIVAVYFGPHLLGELHASDAYAIRSIRVRQSRTGRGG